MVALRWAERTPGQAQRLKAPSNLLLGSVPPVNPLYTLLNIKLKPTVALSLKGWNSNLSVTSLQLSKASIQFEKVCLLS